MARTEPEGFLARYRAYEDENVKSLMWGLGTTIIGGGIAIAGVLLTQSDWFFLAFPGGILASFPVFRGMARAGRKQRELKASLYAPLGIEPQGPLGSDHAPGAILSEFIAELPDGRRGEVRVISNGDRADPTVVFSEISTGEILDGAKALSSSEPQKSLAA